MDSLPTGLGWLACNSIPAVPFAATNPFEAMGRNFRGEYAQFHVSDLLSFLALVAVVGATAWFLWRRLAREESGKPYYKPRRLFRELCDAHGLDTPERVLLRDLARAYGMEQPAQIFLQRERFRMEKLPVEWRSRKTEIEALAAQLFAAPAETPQS